MLTGSYFCERIPKVWFLLFTFLEACLCGVGFSSEFNSEYCVFVVKANAIISYNNRPATEAVPYFEQVSSFANLLQIKYIAAFLFL